MTLEELINVYQLENYQFFVRNNMDRVVINKVFIFDNHQQYLDKYLNFYKELDNLTEVIIYATNGFFKLTENGVEFFVQHGHQSQFTDKIGNLRGINPAILNEVKQKLIMNIDVINAVKDFTELIEIVNECKVKGFGELGIYDTSVRIASYLDIMPDSVYLHAGARDGCFELEAKGYLPMGSSELASIKVIALPKILQQFNPIYLEHFFCAAKDKLKVIEPFKLIS